MVRTATPPQGENPVYVWVPLSRHKKKRKKTGPEDDEEVSDLQVGAALVVSRHMPWGTAPHPPPCGLLPSYLHRAAWGRQVQGPAG